MILLERRFQQFPLIMTRRLDVEGKPEVVQVQDVFHFHETLASKPKIPVRADVGFETKIIRF